jgi:uncharacterized protein (TIGR02266 family)
MPYTVQVEFRTASSFLVAYSVNLSRGGLFLETDADIPTGAAMTLDFNVPNAGTASLNGVVMWRRGHDQAAEGPPGIGVEFQDVAPTLNRMIDKLVDGFRGVQVLLLSGDRQDRTSLARSVKSIISTAEITQAADTNRYRDRRCRLRSDGRDADHQQGAHAEPAGADDRAHVQSRAP